MRLLFAWLVLVAFGSLATSCRVHPGPEFFEEQPVGSDHWVPVDGLPSWTSAPPTKMGARYFIETAQSDLRSLVARKGGPLPSAFLLENVSNALSPMVGEKPAARVAQDVLGKLTLVSRACQLEVHGPSGSIPDRTWTAWALWELPLDAAVATVPEEHRAAARDLLSTMDLTSRP